MRALQDVQRLMTGEAGVDGHECRARVVRAQRGDDPVGRVRRPDRDAVARLDAFGEVRPRRRAHAVEQVHEGQARVAVDNRLGGSEAKRRLGERLRDGRQGLAPDT